MRLRQVALVARDLDRNVEELCEVLGIDVAYNDPNMVVFGLENAVMPVGETFLEIVSPAKEGTTAGRYLERRGGDGGYMLVLQVSDLDRERERVEKLGVRVVWEVELGRAKVIHLHPRDIGGSLVSFDQMSEWNEGEWAGPDWRSKVRHDSTTGIVAAELQSDDPERSATRWSEALGIPRRGLEIPLQEGTLRFVEAADGRGEGLGGVDIAAADASEVLKRARNRGLPVDGGCISLCGIRVRLV